MVCTGLRFQYRVKSGKMNPDIAWEALRMMFPNSKQQWDHIFGEKREIAVDTDQGRVVILFSADFQNFDIRCNSPALTARVRDRMQQYYTAAIQVKGLAKQGYQVKQVQEVGQKLVLRG